MRHGKSTDLDTACLNSEGVYGVHIIESGLYGNELSVLVKNVANKLSDNVTATHKERFLVFGLGEEASTKLGKLVAGAVSVKAVNGVADLEDAEGVRVGLVFLCEGKKSGDHRDTDVLMVGGLSVDNSYALGGLDAEFLILSHIGPDVGVNLVHTVALYKDVLHSVLRGVDNLLANGGKCTCRGEYLEVVVAVNSGDLLDDVGLDGNVLGSTPGRNDNGEIVTLAGNLEAKAGEGLYDLLVGDLDTRVTIYVLFIEVKSDGGVLSYVRIGECGDNSRAAVKLHKECKKALGRSAAKLGVKHLLISHRSIGTKAKTSGGLTNGNTVEGCRLKKKRVGVILDLGCVAAHNTCDSNGGVARGDHKHLVVNIALDTVEGSELKTLCEGLHLDLINLAVVECVHRLTDLHHYVVGEVGKEIDSAGAAVEKADAHIYRAYLTGDVLNLDSRVTPYELGCLNVDSNGGKVLIHLGVVEHGCLKLSAGDGSELTSHTVVAPKVGAVGKGLVVNLEDDIVDVVNGLDVGAKRNIVGDIPDARVVVADAKLSLGAAHTVGGKAGDGCGGDLVAANCAAVGRKCNLHTLADVGCAANDINDAATRVNFKKVKLLRGGVIFNGYDLGNDNAVGVGALLYNVLNLSGREGEVADKRLLIKSGKINEIADPIHR